MKNIKIAWLGNLGNVGFNTVKMLNKYDVQATLFLPKTGLKHFKIGNPEFEYPGASAEKYIYIYRRNYLSLLMRKLGICDCLQNSEKFIGKNYTIIQAQTCNEIAAMRIKKRYGIPYLALTTGADLSEVAFENSSFGRSYRESLQNASHIFLTNIDQFASIRRLNIPLPSYSYMPFNININNFPPIPNIIGDKIIFYSISSQDWTSETRKSIKRNDIFIKGFARFILENKIENYELWIADWGVDANNTRDLVTSSKIDKFVKFIPLADKKEFYSNLKKSNIAVDQFSLGAIGLASLEAMAMSRPVFAYCNPDFSREAYGEMIPVINCVNEEEVFNNLKKIDDKFINETSFNSYKWVSKYHAEERIFNILYETYSRILFK